MRLKLSISTFILLISLLTLGQQSRKTQLYGIWKLSSGRHNGQSAPASLSDRIQYFNRDQTFESHAKTNKGIVKANAGKFFLLNDSTIVTYHQDLLGKLENVANTYNFKIRNDSLHFYGFYLRQAPQNPSLLIKIYIDEWWVKSDKK
jgi:hypothetical protein